MLLLALVAPGPAHSAESGFAFLRAPVSARGAALGGSGVSYLDGAAASFVNPAAIAARGADAGSESPWGLAGDASLTHHESLADLRQESVAVAGSRGPQAVALSFTSLYSERIEQRDEVGLLLGGYGLTDIAAALTYGVALNTEWRWGLTLSYVDESFAGYRASTWSVGTGARFQPASLSGLSLGASVLQLGPSGHFTVEGAKGDPVALPLTLQAGGSYALDFSAKSSLLLIAEGRQAKDEDLTGHFGAEFAYDLLALRAGYRANADVGELAAGAGLKTGRFRFDYAFVSFGDGLGDTHRAELGILFGL